MATKQMMTNRISALLAPSFAAIDQTKRLDQTRKFGQIKEIERTKGQSFWRQCQRRYTFQPIYRTSGALLAIELLTAVFHPSAPETRLSPEDYFSAISTGARLDVVLEQLNMVKQWHQIFVHHSVLVSINIDGQVLVAMQEDHAAKRLIDAMPYIRFELLEHVDTSLDTPSRVLPKLIDSGWTISVAGWRISPHSLAGAMNILKWPEICLLYCKTVRQEIGSFSH